MNLEFNPRTVGQVLLAAWQRGTLLRELPPGIKPTNLGEGYDAQDVLFELSGDGRSGWKLGVGSPAQMRSSDLSRPLIGQLHKARCHASGIWLRMPSVDPVTVECEVAFVLDRNLPPLEGRQVDPMDIRHMCVTFEIVRSRFVDRRAVGWPSFVADNVGFEALVASEPVCEGLDLNALRKVNDSAIVSLNNQEVARALSGDAATDPLQSLAALYAHATERGVTLMAGEIVSTGAMCKPFDVRGPGHAISVAFAGGELSFQL